LVSYFMLIVNDAHSVSDTRVPAARVALHRLNRALWPLYKGTKNRNAITPGDKVVVYVAGEHKHRQTFLAYASVAAVESSGRRHATIDPEDLLTDAAYKVLRLRDVVFLQPPVEIRPLLGKLSFLRKTNRWGAALVGGCRSMTARDFRRVAPEASPRVGLAPNAPGFAGA